MSFIGASRPPVVMGIVGLGWVHYLETVSRAAHDFGSGRLQSALQNRGRGSVCVATLLGPEGYASRDSLWDPGLSAGWGGQWPAVPAAVPCV